MMLSAARQAPSSHHVQAYSIVSVKDSDNRRKLAALCGNQPYVEQAPVFLVFLLDFYKHKQAADTHGESIAVGEVEDLLVGAVDTALIAQNTLLAAQSLGLGGVMIGGIRNEADQVAKLLELPPWTVPLMGLCLGYPDEDHAQKPRMPLDGFYYEDHYSTGGLPEALARYERITEDYYRNRTQNPKPDGWGRQMSDYLKKPRRQALTAFIKEQGFLKG